MQRQKARDVAAGIFIGLMFVGAFILPATALGFVLIGLGGVGMIVLIAWSM